MLATEGEGMKLTAAEQESLTEGDVITRKVRTRKSGREYGCSIKVGDAVKVGDRVLAVCSVRKDRGRWVIRFEEVGEWAIPKPKLLPLPTSEFRKITEDIRRGAKVLVWPAVNEKSQTIPCPVEKGQSIPIPGVPVIEIESVNRKLPAGRKAEWHVTFVRHEIDRPQLLRRVPSGLASTVRDQVGLSESEKARIDGEYTSSLALSLGKEEPESVGADWSDPKAGEREAQRQMDRRETIRQEDELLKVAARLRQVGKQSSRSGRNLTPLLKDIYDRLAEEERELRDAA